MLASGILGYLTASKRDLLTGKRGSLSDEKAARRKICVCCCLATLHGRPPFQDGFNKIWQENDNKCEINIKRYGLFWTDVQMCQNEGVQFRCCWKRAWYRNGNGEVCSLWFAQSHFCRNHRALRPFLLVSGIASDLIFAIIQAAVIPVSCFSCTVRLK